MDPIPHPQTQNDDHTLSKNPLPTNNQPTNPSSVVNNTAAPSSASAAPASPVSAAPSSPTPAPTASSSPTPAPTASSSPTPAPTASPELDSLMSELSNYQPTTDDLQPSTGSSASMESTSNASPSSLAPTDPTLSVSSFSAAPSTSNSGLTSDPGLMFDPVQSQQDDSALDSTPFTASASTQPSVDVVGSEQASQTAQTEANEDDDQEEQPLVAAAPAPGSIGSAISYADFEKKQAEEAAKQAKNQNKPKIKLNRTMILIIAAAVLFVIAGIIFALMFLSEPQKKPTQAAGKNQVEKASTKMLTCVRPLSTNESSEVGAAYGNFERQFTFENDNLSGISEHYIYQYNSENEAVAAKTTLDAGIKSDDNIKVTTEINLNQLKKKTAISGNNVDNYLKSLSEFSSITNHDLNSLMLAENQTGLSCSTVE